MIVSMRPGQTSGPFCDVSSAFLHASASEEYQEFTIKAPPEVGYLFSDSKRKPGRHVRLINHSMNSLQHPVLGGWTSHRNFLSLDGNPRRLTILVVLLL